MLEIDFIDDNNGIVYREMLDESPLSLAGSTRVVATNLTGTNIAFIKLKRNGLRSLYSNERAAYEDLQKRHQKLLDFLRENFPDLETCHGDCGYI